jgi:CheY-like chemotaxis protein
MNVEPGQTSQPVNKISILLMDSNTDRRALRKKILKLHGIEVVGASDLVEATSIWHRDRYDAVLIDIRMDHRGCIAWRDEIKKEKPRQIVAFLVGKPNYVDLDPLLGSYVAEEHGVQWADSMRRAIRDSCASLPQRNGFVEAGWRIAAARRLNGGSNKTSETEPVKNAESVPADIVEN